MVNISKALNAAQVQSYHEKDYSSDTQRYYAKDDASSGVWQGALAEKFGLSGEVKPEDFSKLSNGINPETGEAMVKHRAAMEYKNEDGSVTKAVEHRAGWDATFSAPKSVSLTALVGGDQQVIEAHRSAVTTALEELERHTQARLGGNKPAETTGKFIAAKFEHDTARPVDGYAAPQLHTHAVIFNVTERENGKTRALQEKALFETQNYATAVYQSALTYNLRNLGYELERGRSGAPEIKGYSQEYLDASSPRSQQIKERLAEVGRSGPEAAQIAAHATREKKQTLSKSEVLDAHQKVASDFGNQPQQVIARAMAKAQTQDVRQDVNAAARQAVSYAREHIYEREAVADKRSIMTTALRRGMGDTTFAEVHKEFQKAQENGAFTTVAAKKYSSSQSFTTPETITAERANIQAVAQGKNALKPIMPEREAMNQAATREFLNSSQRRVIEEVLTSSDRIHGLQGLAGTGKTTTLEVIREGAEKNGYAVQGFAPTSRAAGQLRDAGVDAKTLQSFLASNTQKSAGTPHLYMLDESSLASTKQMHAFLGKIGPNDRVLVIGDTRQHQGVDAGRPFQQMQEAGMQTSRLDQIMRQKDPELLKAVQHLATGEVKKGVAMLSDQKRITQVENAAERVSAIAKDYVANPTNTIIVSPDNRSRQQINEAVRGELIIKGSVSDNGREVKTLAYRSELTGAGRTWAALYQAGDVIQYGTGSPKFGLSKDSTAVVKSIDPTANTLTVEKPDGQSVTYDPRRLRGVSVFEEKPRNFATGERVQFTAPNKDLGVANRDLGTITSMDGNRITVQLDGRQAKTVTLDTEKFRQLDHGYAVTSHSSQGLTAGRVLVNIDTDSSRTLINDRLAYVAISRASQDARIYTNNAASLGTRLASTVSKTAAIEPPATPATSRQPGQAKPSHQPKRSPQKKSPTDHIELNPAVQAFRDKQPLSAAEALNRQGNLHLYEDQKTRLSAIAKEFTSHQGRSVILASDPDDRQRLTKMIRQDLQMSGRLPVEERSVSILRKQELENPRIAASYTPNDEVHYRKGSPEKHGIADHSVAIIKSIDRTKNLLTVEKADGETVTYNPALLKAQTSQSSVYRSEKRSLSEGDRITFTMADFHSNIRKDGLGTVEKIADNGSISVKLDRRTIIDLTPDQAKHIDHGYAVETTKNFAVSRVILTGDPDQSRPQHEALARLPDKLQQLTMHVTEPKPAIPKQPELAIPTPSVKLPPVEMPNLSIEREGFGITM